jgi:dienelactone hydrolase
MTRLRRLGAACVLATLAGAGPAAAFDPDRDAQNREKSAERAREHQAPEYQAELRTRGAQNSADAAAIQAGDPERNFAMTVCFHLTSGCAGDIRLYDFEKRGRGLVRPVLWTARNGSTVSSHVWATRSGPAKRPAIVITNGSIQAPEQLYWWAAQTLAKAGYVVVTFDPQQQGRSDTYGEGADLNEGVPSQTEGNTFFDWTQDAIDFMLSTPAKRFCARPSRSGTSHCAKQSRRVQQGRNAAFNPFWQLVDASRIGIAGHSYGAAGVSWMGQQDPRVDAVVAWDNLCSPNAAGTSGEGPGAGPCLSGGQGQPPGFRVPSLGITNDSFTGTESRNSDPEPTEKSRASMAFSKAGVDSGSVVIRGGTHFEYSYLPSTAFRATLRGIDLASWYTSAWFDKYVKRDPGANARLVTSRWRSDPGDRAADPAGRGNLYSFYYRSRLDIGLSGGRRFRCEDLRAGKCALAPDCDAATYSYLAIATSPDRPRSGTPCPVALAGTGKRCISRRVGVSSRRLGPARLGRSYKAFFRRYRAVRRSRGATRFCVRGGGRFLVWRRRGKIDTVATTARGHRAGRLGVRRRAPARAAATRRIRGNLFVRRGPGRGGVVYGARRGRVRFLAVVGRRAVKRPGTLVRRLRAARLR